MKIHKIQGDISRDVASSFKNSIAINITRMAGNVIHNANILADELVTLSLGIKNLKYPD